MSKSIVHVLIPNTTDAACATEGFSKVAHVREDVTCRLCKRTEHFRALPNSRAQKKKS